MSSGHQRENPFLKGIHQFWKQKRIVLNCQKVNDFIIIILINGTYFIDVIKTQYILKHLKTALPSPPKEIEQNLPFQKEIL